MSSLYIELSYWYRSNTEKYLSFLAERVNSSYSAEITKQRIAKRFVVKLSGMDGDNI